MGSQDTMRQCASYFGDPFLHVALLSILLATTWVPLIPPPQKFLLFVPKSSGSLWGGTCPGEGMETKLSELLGRELPGCNPYVRPSQGVYRRPEGRLGPRQVRETTHLPC